MKETKIKIEKKKFDINLKFYFFLKYLTRTSLTDNQTAELLKDIFLHKKGVVEDRTQKLIDFADEKLREGTNKKNNFILTISKIEEEIDFDLFIFSLKLYSIKDLLLQEAKAKNLLDISKLEELDPLTLEYDKITVFSPYSTRVSGALLTLLFFDKLENEDLTFVSEDSVEFVQNLSKEAKELKKAGVEPNQVFMLMFSESVNQSIISDSGGNYEDRIKSVLINVGIREDKIVDRSHDDKDSSTEFDFFFDIDGKSYGIGAKRTLRERYKQFIKTAQMSDLDVMIEITLGTDVRPNMAESIVKHGVHLFVADEIYDSKEFLQNQEGVYPTRDFNLETLKNIGK